MHNQLTCSIRGLFTTCLYFLWSMTTTTTTMAYETYEVTYDVPMEKADPPLMNPRATFPEITHRVYFTIEIDGKEVDEKIVFGLFGKALPKTVENFVSLAKCDRGNSKHYGKPLCYRGTPFHRIVHDFGMTGGDFVYHDGTGGESIYGGTFEDESFEVKHNRKNLISMANRGRNTNGSQFFINTVKVQWLDGKYVIFGMVLEGDDVVHGIENYGQLGGTPRAKVVIKDCGVLPLEPEDKEVHYVNEWITE